VTRRHGQRVRTIAPHNNAILDGVVKTPVPVEPRTLTGTGVLWISRS
jgi:hypothetical protein